MSFKVGDKICVLDQDIEGVVTSITTAAIEVETTFGFLMKFSARELLILPEEGLKVSNYDVAKIKHLKQDKKPNYKAHVSKKERDVPKMEVDLHIGQLTNATNLSNFEMLNIQLDTAQRQLEFAISKKIQKVQKHVYLSEKECGSFIATASGELLKFIKKEKVKLSK